MGKLEEEYEFPFESISWYVSVHLVGLVVLLKLFDKAKKLIGDNADLNLF